LAGWKRVSGFLNEGDLVLHAGDILYHGPRNPLPEGYNPKELAEAINSLKPPALFARGNCDADVDQLLLRFPIQSPYIFCFLEGLRIIVLHELDQRSRQMIELYEPDILVFGHTHKPDLSKEGKTLLLNPGSLSLPKDSEPTFALIDTAEGSVYVLSLEGNVVLQTKI
ncbi:MAG: phosphodiesterase, partial [Deltaproteobacteria bacterium]